MCYGCPILLLESRRVNVSAVTEYQGDTEMQPQEDPANITDRRHFLKMAGSVLAATSLAGLSEACQKAAPVVPSTPPTPAPSENHTTAVTPPPAEPPIVTPPAVPVQQPLRARIAILLGRAGFGASKTELDNFEAMGIEKTVSYLLDYEKVDDSDLETRLLSLDLDLTKMGELVRMAYSRRPLQEKITLFWHGLLTSGISKVGNVDFMLQQNQLFRQAGLGSFPALLKKAFRDPAMLIWLDSRSNQKSAPNENFARELMELFTIGPGNYTERDVREAARAFTGWFLRANHSSFEPSQFDSGTKTFLGETGIFNSDNIIDIIVKQPATSDFICRKLFSFFSYAPPHSDTISKMRDAFERDGYSIKAAMRELLTSDAFYTVDERSLRPKSPAELVVETIRTLKINSDVSGLAALLTRMGQTLFDPPNVAGWPGGATWINSSTLLERINFANRIATDRKSFSPQVDAAKNGVSTPQNVADYFIDLLFEGGLTPTRREELLNQIRVFLDTANADVNSRAVVYLFLSSPDYQLV